MTDGVEGRVRFAADRKDVLSSLKVHLTQRFLKVLDVPVINAYAIFDHRKWPTADKLDGFGAPEISLLYNQYKHFFDDTTLPDLYIEWYALMKEILSAKGLKGRDFTSLWSHMIANFADEYRYVLRFVVFMMLMPLDTSMCERMFSLMNNIKSSERSRMGQRNLRNLMAWHSHGKDVTHQQLPWITIMNEFKLLAGNAGRKTHKKFVRDSAASASAPAPAPS